MGQMTRSSIQKRLAARINKALILRAEINTNVGSTLRGILLWLQEVSKPEEIPLLRLGLFLPRSGNLLAVPTTLGLLVRAEE